MKEIYDKESCEGKLKISCLLASLDLSLFSMGRACIYILAASNLPDTFFEFYSVSQQ